MLFHLLRVSAIMPEYEVTMHQHYDKTHSLLYTQTVLSGITKSQSTSFTLYNWIHLYGKVFMSVVFSNF